MTLIVMVFLVYAGWPPPDVNEAHYLAKAKSFWDPSWCPGDHFLESADAHLVFYGTFGWITNFMSLGTAAWIGRVLTWFLLAGALRSLFVVLVPIRIYCVLAAALTMCLWTHAHMAGEWVVGGVEAKGFAYALVFAALGLLAQGKWNAVWPVLGAASAFHVLVGGWSVMAAGFAWLLSGASERPKLRSMILPLGLGLLLSLPGLVPTLSLNWHADADVAKQANQIYVFRRLGHHLAFHQFPAHVIVRHFCMIGVWGIIAWRLPQMRLAHRRFHGFVLGAVVLVVVGFLVDRLTWISPALSASLLRFYWFRLSDVVVPIGLVIALGQTQLVLSQSRQRLAQWMMGGGICLAALGLVQPVLRFQIDKRPGAERQSYSLETLDPIQARQLHSDWVDICRWVRENTQPDERLLTPLRQQTFKWYAHRSEVVTWKDVPQDAKAIQQWWERKRNVERLFSQWDSPAAGPMLVQMAKEYKFRLILLPRSHLLKWNLPCIYANSSFGACRVDKSSTAKPITTGLQVYVIHGENY